ncbi:DsbA family oxidoreductase [Virgibacillus soli]|uniref:DsbA family oxidoreductase n=1 Tax=Paracerasibacillus soli TaxID=480284 RepID=A0ABU5CVJ5_9BACI|nr:DsbA family oxidoreductase [Virgibacillus soli]MDY0410394.1 DsbA family oxidoreductase [Virgibacillus soli]
MKIEVWSDFVCPFCYIGKRRLEEALHAFPYRDHVVVQYKSYELNPQAKHDPTRSYFELLADKFQSSVEDAARTSAQIADQARELGLDYQFEKMQPTNTFHAHRLVKYAEKVGKGNELVERLFHAYFTDAKLISNQDTLLQLASDIGLQRDKVEEILHANKFGKRVREEEEQAYEIGIQGVPFYIFNEKYAVSGAQPPEVFEQVLNQVWELEKEEQNTIQLTSLNNDETSFCTDEGCEVQKKDW